SNVTFTYTVIVKATSSDHRVHSIDIPITPPPPEFTFTVSALSLATIPGGSGGLSVNIVSHDYFEGIVYLFATSPSGTRLSYSPPKVSICIVQHVACAYRVESGSSNFTLNADPSLATGTHYVILRAVATTVLFNNQLTSELGFKTLELTHTLNVTLTVGASTGSGGNLGPRTILGLQPLTYFGVIAGLGVALTVAAVREVRRPKDSERRSVLLDEKPLSTNQLSPAQRAKIAMEEASAKKKKKEEDSG
ncbi:MAG TPA: hypothetical protein VE177_06445, partial [Candidatus Binatus sp.]|nr:hypothetical protein [Candidatus Binatus sp.]